MLQWGRVLKDAEMGACSGNPGQAVELQWGRVLKDAEIASKSSLRKEALPLQWGRVLKDAEMREVEAFAGYPIAASMGPRLEGRGNLS